MAFHHGKNAILFVSDSESLQRRWSHMLREISFSGDVDVVETTAMGAAAKSSIIGLPGARMSVRGMADLDLYINYSLNPYRVDKAAFGIAGKEYPSSGRNANGAVNNGHLIDYYPVGVPGVLISGYAHLTSIRQLGTIGGLTEFEAEFIFTSPITRQLTPTPGDGTGTTENFTGTAGTNLGSPWTDAADAKPTQYGDVVLEGNGLAMIPDADHAASAAPYTGWTVSHAVATRAMGSTSGEVSILWDYSSFGARNWLSQVAPAFGLDLGANYLEQGVTYVYDIGEGGNSYAQNVFESASIADCLDPPLYYRVIANTVHYGWPVATADPPVINPGPNQAWVTLRTDGTKFTAWWNGIRTLPPTAIPSWALGRDGWGFHVVSIAPPIGVPSPWFGGETPTELWSARWSAWNYRTYNGPL